MYMGYVILFNGFSYPRGWRGVTAINRPINEHFRVCICVCNKHIKNKIISIRDELTPNTTLVPKRSDAEDLFSNFKTFAIYATVV